MARRFDRLGWAMAQEDLSSPQKFVLVVLADAANEADGECWLKYATIAERTSLGVTTVRDAVRHLIENGLLRSSVRYDKGGRQTSNLYQLGCYESVAEGVGSRHPGDDEGVDSRQGEVSGADTSTRTSQKQPPNRKNNSSTTSKSSSSRRASARRGDDGWGDRARDVFDEPGADDDFDEPKVKHGHDSAWGLNKHYRDAVRVAGNGFLGNTNDKAMMGFFAAAKRQGIKPGVLRQMVDLFVTDDRLFMRADGARWRVFIANAESLRQRVAVAASVGRRTDFSKVPEFGGSIPQHILDEILAEAG